MFRQKSFLEQGQLLVELLVAIGFFGVLAPALLTGYSASTEGQITEIRRKEAVAAAQEAYEAVRNAREEDWENVETDGVFHARETATNWNLVPGASSTGELTQEITIASVQRDSETGTISASGDYVDPSTKEVTIDVSWTNPFPGSISQQTFLTRIENLSELFTTVLDFEAPGSVLSDVIVKNDAGGEVQSEGYGLTGAGFCEPTIVETIDLAGSADAKGLWAVEGNVYIGTGWNDSGNALTHVTLDNENPPEGQIAGEYSGPIPRSNFVWGDGGEYAIIATDDNSREVSIIDLNTLTEVGYFNVPGSRDGISVVAKSGEVGFVTASNGYLYSFDLSSPNGSRPTLDSTYMWATGSNLFLRGDYLYVSMNSFFTHLRIYDVSNPSNIQLVETESVPSVQFARDIYVNEDEDRAYLVTTWFPFSDEFYILDISNKSEADIISSYSTDWMSAEGVTVGTNDTVALIGGFGAIEYQVIDISVETAPTLCGSSNIDTGVYDVVAIKEADGDHYGFLATGDSDQELVVIAGGSGLDEGPGGAGGAFYESATLDAGHSSAFNRFSASTIEPGDSNVQYQISIVDEASGSCSLSPSAFVGPDGTSDSFFDENEGLIPFDSDDSGYENPGQCMRYRAYFQSENPDEQPELLDFTVNYSP